MTEHTVEAEESAEQALGERNAKSLANVYHTMSPEDCGICDDRVSFSDTVHVMIHTHSEEGVLDYYVCKRCYEDGLRPLFSAPEAPEP